MQISKNQQNFLNLVSNAEGGKIECLRFESELFYNSYEAEILDYIISTHSSIFLSSATAKMLYNTSYGKYQLMGFNIFNILKNNIKDKTYLYIDILNNKDNIQDLTFFIFCSYFFKNNNYDSYYNILKNSDIMLNNFCKFYNGPAVSIEYIKKYKEFMRNN